MSALAPPRRPARWAIAFTALVVSVLPSPSAAQVLSLDPAASAAVPGVRNSSVAWGDYTGNGALDLVVTGLDPSGAFVGQVYRNDGSGGLSLDADASAVVTDVSQGSVAWGDYTGDGALDLVVTGRDAESGFVSEVYRNDGSGGLARDSEASVTVADVRSSSVAWGDYTGDGALDLIVTGLTPTFERVSLVYRNDGAGTLELDPDASAVVAGVFVSSVAWGDYTGDGALDLVVTGFGSPLNSVGAVYRNDGAGRLALDPDASAVVTDVSQGSVAWGDYTGDGVLDLVVTGSAQNGFVSELYRNDGTGGLTLDAASRFVVGVSSSSVAWGDYTGDGSLDLVVTGTDNSGGPVAFLYRNGGDGTLRPSTDFRPVITGVRQSSVAWGDYTGDGALDLIVTGFSPAFQPVSLVYRNEPPVPCTSSSLLSFDANGSSLVGLITEDDFSTVAGGSFRGATGEFAGVRNESPGTDVDLSACSFVTFDPRSEAVRYSASLAGSVAPGDVYVLASSGGDQALPDDVLFDSPGAFALIEGTARTGDPVAALIDRVVAAVVYDRDRNVFASRGGGATDAEIQEFNQAFLNFVGGWPTSADGAEGVDLTIAAWPNPTRGASTVAFGLTEGGATRVAVYDVLGREVAVAADRAFGAGRHEVALPVLTAGAYVVRVASEAGVRTVRLTVAR